MSQLWIEEKLKGLKKKKSDLGAALGLPPSRITDILKGTRQIQSHEVTPLSQFLKMDVNTILHNLDKERLTNTRQSPLRTETIPVIGALEQLGKHYTIWPEGQIYTVTFPRHPRYTRLKKFAIEDVSLKKKSLSIYICVSKPKKDRLSGEPSEFLFARHPDSLSQNPGLSPVAALIVAEYRQI